MQSDITAAPAIPAQPVQPAAAAAVEKKQHTTCKLQVLCDQHILFPWNI